MHGVILASGRGKRLAPLTDTTPKPLLEVGGRPIIEHQIRQLKEGGITDITVTVSYRSDDIKERLGDGSELGVNIRYVEHDLEVGSAGIIREVAEKIPPEESFVLLYGDILSEVDVAELIRSHQEANRPITMVYLEHQIPVGVIDIVDGEFVGFEEKPAIYGNAAIFVFDRYWTANNLPKEGDLSRGVWDNLTREDSYLINLVGFDGYWRHIVNEGDLIMANREFKEDRRDPELNPLRRGKEY